MFYNETLYSNKPKVPTKITPNRGDRSELHWLHYDSNTKIHYVAINVYYHKNACVHEKIINQYT